MFITLTIQKLFAILDIFFKFAVYSRVVPEIVAFAFLCEGVHSASEITALHLGLIIAFEVFNSVSPIIICVSPSVVPVAVGIIVVSPIIVPSVSVVPSIWVVGAIPSGSEKVPHIVTKRKGVVPLPLTVSADPFPFWNVTQRGVQAIGMTAEVLARIANQQQVSVLPRIANIAQIVT